MNALTRSDWLTPELVRGLWDHLSQEFGSRIVDKSNSKQMRIAARALQLMGVLNRDVFLSRYATTVGRRIYLPFEVGDPNCGWSLWNQVTLAVHEHQHLVQFRSKGMLVFVAQYLLSRNKRALLEAEAFRSDMEMKHWRSGEVPSPRRLAERLKNYGCTSQNIDTAEKFLKTSAKTVARGGIVNEASQAAITWLEQQRAQG